MGHASERAVIDGTRERDGVGGIRTTALVVAVAAAVGMLAYELSEHLLTSKMSPTAAHAIAILLCGAVAACVAHRALRTRLEAQAAGLRRAEESRRASEQFLALALDVARMGTWERDLATGEISRSENLTQLIDGAGATGITLDAWLARVHIDDRARVTAALCHDPSVPQIGDLEYRLVGADGSTRWLATRDLVVVDDAERPVKILGVTQDVTERKEAEAALRRGQERYRGLFEASPRPMWVYDLETLAFLAVNDAAVREYGYTAEEFLGMRITDIPPEEDREALVRVVTAASEPYHHSGDWRHLTKGGMLVDVEITTHSIAFDGRQARLVLITDVTERKRAEVALRDSEARFRSVFDQAAIGISVVDAAGRLIDTNPAFQQFVGYTEEELRGFPARDLSPKEDAGITRGPVREIKAGTRNSATVEKRFVRQDGEVVWGSLTVSRLDAVGGAAMVGMVQDITSRKELEAQLTHQAFHDPLTSLANRALFRDRVEHALSRTTRGADGAADGVAVLFLDVDDFKTVNDSLGHAEGDRLLAAISARLLGATRGCDTVARLGGDEFAVLLEDVHDDDAAIAVAERIASALRAPITLQGRELLVGASIGVARARGADGATELLRNADLAMYRAKGRGKGRHELFEPAMHTAIVDRMELVGDLRQAMTHHVGRELRLLYQPIVELGSGRVIGVEALVRWQHPTRGLVSPAAFIPLAEETGLIVQLGRWVIGEACRQGRLWDTRASSDAAPAISVNISGRQLQHPELVDDVAAALAESGLEAHRLVLEITESVIMQHTEATLRKLHALKALGVRLAIDDFGTGYSSLSYLQRFPVDVLKIDKAFVDGVGRGGNDAALARTIIALGDMLQLRTVAEGVELPEQRVQLRALGCELGQGFLFAKPMSVDEISALLARGFADGEAVPASATARVT